MIEEHEAYRSKYLKLEKRLEYLATLIGVKKPSKRSRILQGTVPSVSEKKA